MSDLGLGIVVTLKDAFTQNAMRVQSSMESLDSSVAKASENMTRNLGLIEKGTMMVGAGLALLAVPTALVASTAATQKALGELASVGVKDFRAMEDAAESFTNQWAGTNKAEFITAAYDVKSALASLSDQAVGTFASMAALTAKATKATTEEMVGTFTTAYGIFKPIMQDMSDIDWAKTFSGALAQTVSAFKTTGPQMAEAIKNVGAIAAASNVPLQEQMAILGQLQTTMPGSEAGTLYKAFMLQVAKAGQELGLSFVDAGGRLKGIVPILQELKRGFPDLSNAAAQVKLKKAFGSDEAVRFLLQMSMGMDQLEGNIRAVGQAMKGGTAVTLDMARAMNMDIGSRYGLVKQQIANLAEILGRTLLPVVIPVFQAVSRFILYLQGVAKSAPGVTRVILTLCAALGAVLVVVGSVTAALGTVGILLPAVKAGIAAIGPMLAGVGSAVFAYFWPVVAIIAAVIIAVIALRKAWETNFGGIRDVVMGAWNNVSLAFQGIRALIGSLSGGTGQMSAELARKLQAAGLMKFGTTAFQVYYRVREFLSGLWQAFSSAFGTIRAILEPVVRALMGAFGELGKALGSVFAAFELAATAADASSFKGFGQTLGTLLGIIAQVAAYVIKFVVTPLTWVIRVVAAVVRGVVWLGKTVVTAFVTAAPYVYRFSLPPRMLVQTLFTVGRIARGSLVSVTGTVALADDGEREIVDAQVSSNGQDAVSFQGLPNKHLGGGDYNVYTPGIGYPTGSGVGVYNKASLVKTWGKVTGIDAEAKCFYIDDGAQLNDGSGLIGVRVTWDWPGKSAIAPPEQGAYVGVVGISGSVNLGNNHIARCIRIRDQDDLTSYADAPYSCECDRGLPDTNLNNSAGESRCNIRWANSDGNIGVGDDFSLQTGNWIIDGIRVWVVPQVSMWPTYSLGDHFESIALYVGAPGGSLTQLSGGTFTPGTSSTDNPNISFVRVKYQNQNEKDYQAADGAYSQVWQVDFSNLNWAVTGGTSYVFGVHAVPRVDRQLFLHATHWTSQGNGLIRRFDVGNLSAGSSTASGSGWFGGKGSDINVQVFAHAAQ